MSEEKSAHTKWAHFRFSVIGHLLAAPPAPGRVQDELRKLSEQTWTHPITGEPRRFALPTIERWFYWAKNERRDPVGRLRRKIRKDCGTQPALSERVRLAILSQYKTHRTWNVKLHYDNLRAAARKDPSLGPIPSYGTVRRFMRAHGLVRRKKKRGPETAAAKAAEARFEEREVRSYEVEHVNALWHLDFHHASRPVLTPAGTWVTPSILGVLDDHSRLACHVQWYLEETAENLVHGLSQAFLKRALPRALMTDNGPAMKAAETTQGLARLGVIHETTLEYCPNQNGKQESFWAQVESRLMSQLENQRDLSLATLNQVTQAWAEMEHNRVVHSETGQAPIERYLAAPDVGRESPSSEDLRFAFTAEETRAQRKSDGTVTIESQRFEVPSRYRHLKRITVRFARWDLSCVYLVDPRTGMALSRLFPLDKARNADGRRRILDADPTEASLRNVPESEPGLPPLLREWMAEYAATGLPPAYLPKDEEIKECPDQAGKEENP